MNSEGEVRRSPWLFRPSSGFVAWERLKARLIVVVREGRKGDVERWVGERIVRIVGWEFIEGPGRV